jgi:hypothetical protein
MVLKQEKKTMKKARLIKKDDIREIKEEARKGGETKEAAKPVMPEWQRRAKRQDPRKAFAELFTQPQTH